VDSHKVIDIHYQICVELDYFLVKPPLGSLFNVSKNWTFI